MSIIWWTAGAIVVYALGASCTAWVMARLGQPDDAIHFMSAGWPIAVPVWLLTKPIVLAVRAAVKHGRAPRE